MASIIGEILSYHNGNTFSLANVYNDTLASDAVKGYIKIRHNNSDAFIPLSNVQSAKNPPCLNFYHNGNNYFALKQQPITLTANISNPITYDSTGTITVNGNSSGEDVNVAIPNAYSDCLTVSYTTSNSAVLQCIKYSSDTIPVTISVNATAEFSAASVTCNVTTQKANVEVSMSTSPNITYNKVAVFKFFKNTTAATSFSYDKTYLTGSGSGSTGANGHYPSTSLKCIKYSANPVPLTLTFDETDNYNSGTATFNITTKKADISLDINDITFNLDEEESISIRNSNLGSGTVTVNIPVDYSDCLSVTSTTWATIKLKCIKNFSSEIPVTVNIAATSNYNSGTTTFNAIFQKLANTFSIDAPNNITLTYNEPYTFNITQNTSGGNLSVTSGSTSHINAQISGSTVTLTCLKYNSTYSEGTGSAYSIPVDVKSASTTGYAASTKRIYCKLQKATPELSAVANAVTYNSTGTINISGNIESGTLTATSSNTDCLVVQSTTSNTVTLKCTNYNASAIPITINVASTTNCNSATTSCNVFTQRATPNILTNQAGYSVAYGDSVTILVNGNSGKGTLTVTSSNSDCLTASVSSTNVIKAQCTKYTSSAVTLTIKSAAKGNYNSATTTCSVTTSKATPNISASIDDPVTYNLTGTIYISGNSGGGNVSATISSTYSSYLATQTSTTSTVVVKCKKYSSSAIPVTINVASTTNYTSTTTTCNVYTQKASPDSISAEDISVAYGSTETIKVSGNIGSGTLIATIPNEYSDCLSVTSTTSATVKVKCLKFSFETIPVYITIPASTNYNSDTVSCNVTTERKLLTAAQSTFSASSVTYDGNVKNVADLLSGYNSSYHTLTSETSATNAGTYTVYVAPKSNYAFSDGSTLPIPVNWSVSQVMVTAPSINSNYATQTYNGNEKYIDANRLLNFDSSTMTFSGETSATKAGTYTVTFGLKDYTNYRWHRASGNGTIHSDFDATWEIAPKKLTKPSLQTSSFTYDGTVKTPTINNLDSDTAFVATDYSTLKATNVKKYLKTVDTYGIQIELKDNKNYCWSDGSVDDLILEWKIVPQSHTKPSFTSSPTFNGTEKDFHDYVSNYDNTYMNYYGSRTVTNAGTYQYSFWLIDKNNHCWAGSTNTNVDTDDVSLSFIVQKSSATVDWDYYPPKHESSGSGYVTAYYKFAFRVISDQAYPEISINSITVTSPDNGATATGEPGKMFSLSYPGAGNYSGTITNYFTADVTFNAGIGYMYFSISAGVDHNAVCSYNLTIDFNIDSINYQSAHISKTVYFQEFGGTVNYTKVVD